MFAVFKDRVFWIKTRVIIIALSLAVGFVFVGQGAWSLSVDRRDALRAMAKEQYTRKIRLSAKRGMISDRYGGELAIEVEVDSIYADPREVDDPVSYAKALAEILNQDEDLLLRRMSSNRHFVWLQRKVTPEIVEQVEKINPKGIYLLKESKRFYPGKELASHIIGFTGIDSNGLEGLERKLDEQLRGSTDAAAGMADASGNIVFSDDLLGPRRGVGNNVTLTIDRNLQFEVEAELENTVRLFQAKTGHITVMDPKSGDVLAMASWPRYNLNDVSSSNPDDRRNRVVLDIFEPGSTFKVFTLAAALNSGVLRPNEQIYCERGRMEFFDAVINDDYRDGWLNPAQCLKRSSNICFAKIASKMGATRFYQYMRRFGFGEQTGIEVPFEMRGQMSHHKDWSEFLTMTIAFGQGIGVSGIQMATALSVIANGGNLMQPNLVKRITDAEGEILFERTPTVKRRVISRKTARLVSDMMATVTEEGGTGTEAVVEGYLVAGKTGTAQKSDGARGYKDNTKYVASFLGFLPADDPKLVISVVIDEPVVNYYGGIVAAPAFRRIADKAMRDMGISPNLTTKGRVASTKEDSSDLPVTEAKNALEDAPGEVPLYSQMLLKKGQVRTPSLTGNSMISVLESLNKANLRPLFMGTGTAVEQVPPAGYPIDEGEYVQVNFAPLQRNLDDDFSSYLERDEK